MTVKSIPITLSINPATKSLCAKGIKQCKFLWDRKWCQAFDKRILGLVRHQKCIDKEQVPKENKRIKELKVGIKSCIHAFYEVPANFVDKNKLLLYLEKLIEEKAIKKEK